jgi:hypothetical protein
MVTGLNSFSLAATGTGLTLKNVSSCELDLNNDNEPDLALLVEASKGRELIVLMKTSSGYNAYVVSRDKPDMNLSCHLGKSVVETTAGTGKVTGKVYKTPGAYIQLKQPEGSSVVYFWNGKGFTEVWMSD